MAEKKKKVSKAKAAPKAKAKKPKKEAAAAAPAVKKEGKAPKPARARPQVSTARVASAADEFRARSADELSTELSKLKKEQFNLRFQRANGQLEKTSRVRIVRKDIARIQTIMNERRRAEVRGA